MTTPSQTLDLPKAAPLLGRAGWAALLVALIIVCMLAPLMNLVVPAGSIFHLSDFAISLIGKIMCYAICALAMDLIWGYTGILSLGHGLFFALGGYAMGMYLMRQIGLDGNYKSGLPDFMVFLDWKTLALAGQRVVCFSNGDGRAGAGLTGTGLWFFCLPLTHQGCVFFHHHAGADVCCHAAVFP